MNLKQNIIYVYDSLIKIFVCIIILNISSTSPLNSDEIKVMSYNLCNYFVNGDKLTPIKSDFSKEALFNTIKSADPDIFIAIEIGGEKSYQDFLNNLKKFGLKYDFHETTQGEDDSRHIVLLSRIKPKEFFVITDLKYKIKIKDTNSYDEIGPQRAFVHVVYEFSPNYRLHIIGAHLKARIFHPRYNQTDMRRYEARLLRYLVNQILEKEKDANILIMGDMNDTYDSSPIRTLRDDNKKPEMKLYDLRPTDKWNLSWTHWWNQNDSYSRIDYAFATFYLLPEISMEKSYIVHVPELWMFASDHRPILITINTKDKPPLQKEFIDKRFPPLPEKITTEED